jgi:hypothetical protein
MRIYADIFAERKNQLDKWGEQHRNLGTGSKTWFNRAEKAKIRCDAQELNSQSDNPDDKATWLAVLEEEFTEAMAESDYAALRAELIQVAAVAVAIIEDIENNWAPHLADKTVYL